MAEWGYVSLSELRNIKGGGWLEVDCEREEFWEVKKAKEIEKIRLAQGWNRGETISDLARDLIPDAAQNPEHTSSMREDRP